MHPSPNLPQSHIKLFTMALGWEKPRLTKPISLTISERLISFIESFCSDSAIEICD